MNTTPEKIGVAISILAACLLVYATLPGLQIFIAPQSELLWQPVLAISQSLGILATIVAIGIMLAVLNRIKSARTSGESIAPLWVLCLLFAVIATLVFAAGAIVVFGVTKSALLEFGLTSSAATAIGIIAGLIAFYILNSRNRE